MAAKKPQKSIKSSKSLKTSKVSQPAAAKTTRVVAKDTAPKKPRSVATPKTMKSAAPIASKVSTDTSAAVKAVEPAATTHLQTTQRSSRNRLGVRPLSSFTILPAAIAEFLGTFILASIVVTQSNQPIALLFGVIAIVLVIGNLSGAHINPLATVAAFVTRRISGMRAGAYIIAQILGAVLALSLLNNFIAQQTKIIPADSQSAQQQQPLYTTPNIVQQQNEKGELEKISSKTASGESILDIRIITTLAAELIGAVILGSAYAASQRQRGRVNVSGRDDEAETSSGNIMAALTLGGGYYLALIIASSAAGAVGTAAILNPAAAIAVEAFSDGQFGVGVGIYIITTIVGGTLGYALYLALHAGSRDKTIHDDLSAK